MGECIIKDKEFKDTEKYLNKIVQETRLLCISYLQQLDIVCTTGIEGSEVVEVIQELAKPLRTFVKTDKIILDSFAGLSTFTMSAVARRISKVNQMDR